MHAFETGDSEPVTRCDRCGDAIDTDEWHPALIDVEQRGETHLFTFCEQDCRDRWQRRHESR